MKWRRESWWLKRVFFETKETSIRLEEWQQTECSASGWVWPPFVVSRAYCVTLMARDGEKAGEGISVGLYLLFCSQSEPGTCPSPCRYPSPCRTSGTASRAPAKRAVLHVVSAHGLTLTHRLSVSEGLILHVLPQRVSGQTHLLSSQPWDELPLISFTQTHVGALKINLLAAIPTSYSSDLHTSEPLAVNRPFTTGEHPAPQLLGCKIYCCHLSGWVSSLWELITLVIFCYF